MSAIEAALILGSVAAVIAVWSVPPRYGQNAVAVITVATMAVVTPVAALWLVGSVALTPPLMRLGEKTGSKSAVVALWATCLAVPLFASRMFGDWGGGTVALMGGAYFTLRHIHVLMEWWYGRLPVPTFGAYARYHLLLPVLAAGPIHRLPHFERQCARRHWSAAEFYSGAERALFGLALAVVGGNFLFAYARLIAQQQLYGVQPLIKEWLLSILDWVRLYVQFTGFTDLALGMSLMMGLRLEENFNRPWQARNLIDFWTRWHMTLSHWCRDYVYVPVAARFRSPLIGVIVAMLVMGLWHETSAYYVLWGLWQALGLALTRAYLRGGDPLRLGRLPEAAQMVIGPAAVLAWLAGARPVIGIVLETLAS